jgi:hypothetical protein
VQTPADPPALEQVDPSVEVLVCVASADVIDPSSTMGPPGVPETA